MHVLLYPSTLRARLPDACVWRGRGGRLWGEGAGSPRFPERLRHSGCGWSWCGRREEWSATTVSHGLTGKLSFHRLICNAVRRGEEEGRDGGEERGRGKSGRRE